MFIAIICTCLFLLGAVSVGTCLNTKDFQDIVEKEKEEK